MATRSRGWPSAYPGPACDPGPMDDDGVLEVRRPELNPWAGFGVLALHSHTAEEPCDPRCTVYRREGHAGDSPSPG